jgi:hypothetical protein
VPQAITPPPPGRASRHEAAQPHLAPHLAEHCAGAPHESLAHRRQDHPAGAPLEQRHAEFALEFVHAPRQCGLCQFKMARGGAQAAAFRYGDDVAKLVELHGTDIRMVSLGLK